MHEEFIQILMSRECGTSPYKCTRRLTPPPNLNLNPKLHLCNFSYKLSCAGCYELAMLSSRCLHEHLHWFEIHSWILFICRLAVHFVLSPNSRNPLIHSSTGCRWHATSLHVMVAQAPRLWREQSDSHDLFGVAFLANTSTQILRRSLLIHS